MTQRILRRIRLDKIAAVDSPCQQHATVAIIKRAPTAEAIAKATFQEALDAAEVSSAVNRAFYEAFDGLWTQNDAFRTALTDELSSGGDGSEASAAYVESVQGLVARAVSAAREAGVEEAADAATVAKFISRAIAEWIATKSSPEETEMKITSKTALRAEIAKFDPATSPAAHVDIIRKAATDLSAEDELPSDGPLAKAAPDPAVAGLQREIAILKLAPAARSHFDTLDEAGQTAFLGKSATDQAAEIEKASGDDPVVYTTQSGVEVRKSAGATAIALAKQVDSLTERVEKAEGSAQSSDFAKRAQSEFPNVAEATAVAMLKSARTLGVDTAEGKDVLKSLKTMNDASAGLFKREGVSGAEPVVSGGIAKARQTFQSKVDSIAKRDGIGKAAAMEKAEVEEPALFAEAYPQTEAADAGAAE